MASEPTAVRVASRGRPAAAGLLVAMRPRQWLKNLLLFAGLVFAAELGDGSRWLRALAAFAIYCAASSAAYLVNDVRDAEADRAHPTKRFRPVASRELSPRNALAAAATLGAVAILGAAALGRDSLLLLLAFLVLQLLYSTWLKHVVLADVLAIASLFVIRAAAGAVAIDVTVSGWLLVCTGLLALFLALNKRRGELAEGGDGSSRRVLRRYDVRLLDHLVLGVGAATLLVYAAYTVTGTRPPLFPLTVVPVAFGLGRYVFLVRRRAAGQEPEKVLVGDPPILLATLAWTVLAAALLAAA